MRVFVLSNTKKPLMPCSPARARQMLRDGKAAVYRRQPFTIILKYRSDGDTQPVEFKVDPGSKITGIALVGGFPKQGRVVLWAANLEHRGQTIRKRLERRRMLRRGRRGRKTRYRPPRFLNRTRPSGWLPPSLRSRVDNVSQWYGRLLFRAPVTEAHVETVRFDMQKMENPEISGVEYQQGELQGYEVKEYLLEKWNRKCAYCGAEHVPLEVEHITPKSKGGSDRVSNLTLACESCNVAKGNHSVEDFLKDKPDVLSQIKSQAKAPLKDAAAVNATRYAIGREIKGYGLPTSFWSGGRTKMNRIAQGYAKEHWTDAVCVGETGASVHIPNVLKLLHIKALGRGKRQVVQTDKYGFPRGKACLRAPHRQAGRIKRVFGFQTGDVVKLVQPHGKYAGTHFGRLVGIRKTGILDIKTITGKISTSWKHFTLIQRTDGYSYGCRACAACLRAPPVCVRIPVCVHRTGRRTGRHRQAGISE